MLKVENLTVSYDIVEAVRGVELAVEAGEAVALIGPNAAGKTSILRAISGLVDYGGTVEFDGADLRGVAADRIARIGLIHVPEGRHVFPTLTVHENLQTGLIARGTRAPSYTLDDVYDLFPQLAPLRGRDGWALSGGEQQMVAIGRALLGAPRLLLLDEPSLGLAPIVSAVVFEALQAVRERTPVLVVEQNTDIALTLCSRAYVLSGGRVVVHRSTSELTNREDLLDSYLGRRDVHAAH
jgi:branched-chain amino acid transport system ATP-binding protein